VALPFAFEHRLEFCAEQAIELLRQVPAAPGVVCLRGERETDQPYLTRAADLRRRLRRLLAPPEEVDDQGRPVLSKRLNLRDRVRSIEWTETGSEFESTLVLYCASRAILGPEEARRRLKLRAPYVVRLTVAHEHPRVYVTNRLSRRSVGESVGPFPSRAAAERYADAVLDLFRLRRCHEDLEVSPDHPGCAYGEMKMCMEPCKGACSREAYREEAERVRAFLLTRGESMLADIAARRDAASEAMDFEAAAALHKQWEKAKTAAQLADEVVRPQAELRAVVVQPAIRVQESEDAALFLLKRGRIVGPERLSTLGVRAVREQTAVGSSLFAQPLMLAAVPLESEGSPDVSAPATPESRAREALELLEEQAISAPAADLAEQADFLALFRRWYYRPEKQRIGEAFLPNTDGAWPVRRILNGAARVVLGPPKELPAVDREAAAARKTRVLHEGREGVERVVPVLPKRTRRKSIVPGDLTS
jgi:hypothetical protein